MKRDETTQIAKEKIKKTVPESSTPAAPTAIPERPKVEFTFETSRKNKVRVVYTPSFARRFEFRGFSISPTGYVCYFPLQDEKIKNPEAYAKIKAEELEEEFFEETKRTLRQGRRGIAGLSMESQLRYIEETIKNAEKAVRAGAILTERENRQIGKLKNWRDVLRSQLGGPGTVGDNGRKEN